MASAKPWWKSRVLRLNTAAAALAALEANTGLLQPLLPVDFYSGLAVLLACGNAVLRVITTQPLCRKTEG